MRTSNRWLGLLGAAVVWSSAGVLAFSSANCIENFFADADCDIINNTEECGTVLHLGFLHSHCPPIEAGSEYPATDGVELQPQARRMASRLCPLPARSSSQDNSRNPRLPMFIRYWYLVVWTSKRPCDKNLPPTQAFKIFSIDQSMIILPRKTILGLQQNEAHEMADVRLFVFELTLTPGVGVDSKQFLVFALSPWVTNVYFL